MLTSDTFVCTYQIEICVRIVQLGVEREPVTVLVRVLRFLVDFGEGFAHNLAIIAKKSCRSLYRHIDASTRFDGKIDR